MHYTVDEKQKSVLLTEDGYEAVEDVLQVTDLYDPRTQWASYIVNALKVSWPAHAMVFACTCLLLYSPAPAPSLRVLLPSLCMDVPGCAWMHQPPSHPDTQTPRHPDTQTPRHPDTQTPRHAE